MTQTELPRGGVLDHVTLTRVDTLSKLDAFRRWAGERREGPLCFDTESAGLQWSRDKHRMTQVGDLHHGWSFSPAWMGGAHEVLAGYEGELGAYNLPYDALVLWAQAGVSVPFSRTHDAQLLCGLADSSKVNKLKPRSAIEIDPAAMAGEKLLADAFRKQHWSFATVPDEFGPYHRYGAMDPVLTAHLIAKFLPLAQARYAQAYDTERAYSRIAVAMMAAGMPVDLPYVEHWTREISAWNATAMEWLAQYGITSVESNDQVEKALAGQGIEIAKRTKSGQACVDKEQMVWYQAHYPHAATMIKTIRDAKKAQYALGRFLGKFAEMADADGLIHCSIHTTGAQRTSRSSITGPAFQTFDTDFPVIRGSFRPPPGHVFISIDADQIELRLAAHFSGDRRLIEDFRKCDESGTGFFLIMAESIYGEPVPKTDRRYKTTKNTSYGIVYGSGEETAAVTAGVPLHEIKVVYRGFKDAYRDLEKDSRELTWKMKRMRRPVVPTLLGRDLVVDKWRAYSAVDYRIQGSAAEILKTGAIRLDAAGYGQYLRLPIHDELLLACPAEEAGHVLAEATRILTDRESFRVPLTWSGSVLPDRWVKC